MANMSSEEKAAMKAEQKAKREAMKAKVANMTPEEKAAWKAAQKGKRGNHDLKSDDSGDQDKPKLQRRKKAVIPAETPEKG